MGNISNLRLLLFLFLLSSYSTYSQPLHWTWAKRAGGTNSDLGISIAIDASGNSFITGIFRDTVTFGDTTIICRGNTDIFVAKYDDNGGLLWVKQAGGINSDAGLSVTADGLGNSYCFNPLIDWNKIPQIRKL